jgi:Protein of unknown function (DUF3379)
MSVTGPDCRHARLYIGAAPRELPPEANTHLAGCADCRRFLDESLALDDRVRRAREVPLARFRQAPATAPRRRFALAASLVLAMLVAGGVWLARPQSALAGEVVRHIEHEAGSWEKHELLPRAEVVEALKQAGVEIDASLPVVYVSACPFRGRRISHFVVRTANGPVTVMLLPHEKVPKRTDFSESGMHGVLVPVREGSIALVSRVAEVPDVLASEVAASVHW